MAMVIVIMGVSGAGKTTLAEKLACELSAGYAEGDSYHTVANIAKMATGTPLDDTDRWPWLDLMAAEIDTWLTAGRDMVLSCSALKRVYRQRLGLGRPGVQLVYLDGSQDFIAQRLASRDGHYMPPSLLESQFAALEVPTDSEAPICVDITLSSAEAIAAIKAGLTAKAVSLTPETGG